MFSTDWTRLRYSSRAIKECSSLSSGPRVGHPRLNTLRVFRLNESQTSPENPEIIMLLINDWRVGLGGCLWSNVVKLVTLLNRVKKAWWGRDASDHSQGVWVPTVSETHCWLWTALNLLFRLQSLCVQEEMDPQQRRCCNTPSCSKLEGKGQRISLLLELAVSRSTKSLFSYYQNTSYAFVLLAAIKSSTGNVPP